MYDERVDFIKTAFMLIPHSSYWIRRLTKPRPPPQPEMGLIQSEVVAIPTMTEPRLVVLGFGQRHETFWLMNEALKSTDEKQ